MIHDWKMELYWRMPVRLQEAALSAYARYLDRFYCSADYENWRDELRRWQRWSRQEIETWQAENVRRIVELAATRVPYYRHAWSTLDWKGVRGEKGLAVLPRVEKQMVRRNEGSFLVDGLDVDSLWLQQTSGTTGTSLRIHWPYAMLPKWWALDEVMIRNIAGVGQGVPRAMMGGRPIIGGNTRRPPYWRFNRRWRQLYLSSYHVSVNTAAGYVAAMRKFGSEWLTGYGSAIAALAESAMEAGISPLPMRAVIVSGDTLTPGMRRSIEEFFRCKCFDNYGQAEGVCLAMECGRGRLHVVWPAGLVEITREDGTRCAAGEIGEIVATGLLNDAMPLVRYRMGDYAAWAADQTCPCGNAGGILNSLEGRVDDYLVTPEGRMIGRLSTALKRGPTIHSAQIVQDRADHAYLLVRPADGYRSADAVAVRDDILERIGRFDLEVVEVREIPKTPRGKAVLVVRLADQPHMKDVYTRLIRR